MHDFSHPQPSSSTAMDSTKNGRIEAALDQLKSQKILNYAAAARDHDVHRTTLARRYCGKTVSRAEANSTYRQRLNDVQEDTLLRYIDSLTDRHIPPTSQIIRNLAEEILKGPVGKNWTSNFIRRHSDRIDSRYLRLIDRVRVSAESIPLFKHFYTLVLSYFAVLWCYY
jgi:Tc5 transposase DNA-binding domain